MNQRVLPGQTGTASFMLQAGDAATPADKAFSGYQAPSGVSPWMNLFRRDSLGTVDNYTTLVRPQLEQNYMNRQVGRDIRGLEQSSRTQMINMQQLRRENQTLQGVATPQFYMNNPSSMQGQQQGQQ
jgi:hypothetical protein